jgi:oligopeptide/dipeptide ABC transporter ATP-binding protein
VGESGCGKTTLARTIVGLYPPTAGSIVFQGRDLAGLPKSDLKDFRRRMQMIFQDPYASLNPRISIQRCLTEPLALHGLGNREERMARVEELVDAVGLHHEDLVKYPHEFSGGQRQRIGIARALMLEPSLLIADEPVSALDVSIQSQVLNLLSDFQTRLALTYIFISHDLTVVRTVSDRVAVMYLGHFVELSSAEDIYAHHRHPYTHALLSAIPRPDPSRRTRRTPLIGDVPSPSAPPPGCVFHTRCKHAREVCRREVPELLELPHDRSHSVACHFSDEFAEDFELHPAVGSTGDRAEESRGGREP